MTYQMFASERFTGHPLAPIYQLVSESDGSVLYEQKGGFLSSFYIALREAGWKSAGHTKDYMLRYCKDQ